jgi:hypothetical protein
MIVCNDAKTNADEVPNILQAILMVNTYATVPTRNILIKNDEQKIGKIFAEAI